MEEENQTEQKEEVKENEQEHDVMKALKDFPNAPTNAEIEEWKAMHGDVFCSGFSELELFVFRPLTRAEWIAFQMKAQEGGDFDLELELVNTCVLWATSFAAKSLETKAGTLNTVHEQIMQQSNFVNPAMAAALVVKL